MSAGGAATGHGRDLAEALGNESDSLPAMVSAQMQATVEYLRAMQRDAPVTDDPDEALRASRERAELLAVLYPTPEDVRVEQVDAGGVPADLLVAPGVRQDRWLLYLHGGAYVAYSPRSHRELAARLARAAGCAALVPDYRLAPEHPYPAAVEDALAAYTWLTGRGPVVVAGDSAGGGLALALVQRLRSSGRTLPRAVALLSAWTDLTLSGESVRSLAAVDVVLDPDRLESSAQRYAGDTDRADPELSPLHADLTGFPPLHLEAGTAEILLDDSTRLADRARQDGVPVSLELLDRLPHVFQVFATTPEAAESTERIGAFLARHLG